MVSTITMAGTLSLLLALLLPRVVFAQTPAVANNPPAPPVIVATSVQGRDDVTLSTIGSGVAQKSVTLFPPVSGEVTAVNFRPGQSVRAGQVLVQLDNRSQRLAAELAAARTDAALALMKRYEGTRGTGAVPESVLDEASAALRAAQIEQRQTSEALRDRSVRAPFDGVVGLADAEVGDRVDPDTPLATLDDRRALRLEFEVPEAYLSRLRPGQALTATSPAFAQRRFAGEITEVDSRVDTTTRTVRVRASLPNPDDVLRSGMSFQVQITLTGAPGVSVPELALQWGRDGSFVWAVRDGKAVQVPARPVQRTDGQVLIDSELKVGESVVVEGVQRLRAGRPVRVVGNGS